MASLKEILSKKTDAQLLYYIENVDKHTEDAVLLALVELKSRNIALQENIDDIVAEKLRTKENAAKNNKAWDKAMVTDERAPQLYSQKSIYIFSILFSVFFGSFMLAENLNTFGKPRWPAIVFGLGYTILTIVVGDYISIGLSYTYIANALGVVLMQAICWDNLIGKETAYRSKPIWKPLIFAVAMMIVIALLFILLYTGAF